MRPSALYQRIALRELARHPGRALLTLLSVVIGVAAVLAVGLSTATARRAYQEMYGTITGQAALEIVGVGGESFDAALLDEVRETPGVRGAVPLIQRNAILYYGGGRLKLLALGIDPTVDEQVRDYELIEGQMFPLDRGVLLDSSLARTLGVKVGDNVRLLARRGLVRTGVVGLVKPRSGSAVSSGAVLFMPLASAQRRFAAPRQLDRIQLVLADDAQLESVQSKLARQLPPEVRVQQPSTRSPLAEETMLALDNGLRLATAFSLLAAVFIVMNTFQMNVGQRRQQLAVLRAIGATRTQVARLLLWEAIWMALAGTVLGGLAGLAGARLLNDAMGSLFQATLPPVQIRAVPLAVAAAFGVGAALLGVALPARTAARVSPLEGMSGVVRENVEGHSWRAAVAGSIILLLSAGQFAACLAGWLPLELSVVVTVLALVGLVMLLPSALRPLTYAGELALRPIAPVEARLARRQLLRHGGRSTLTIGVLFIAVSTGLGLAHSVVDNVEDVRHWYRTAVVGDFFVRAAMPDMETGLSAAVPDTVGNDLKSIAGITRINNLRFVSATVNGLSTIAIAVGREWNTGEPRPPGMTAFNPPAGDQVLIGSVLAQRLGLRAGDSISLDTRQGKKQQLKIMAVVNDYVAGGLTVHMNRQLAERLLGIEGVDAYVIKADRARLAEVEAALQDQCANHGLLLQSYADLTQTIEGMMAGVVGGLWALLVLGLVVAAFGVANTLGMNVLEQTRELGMLRVVAMTRGQVRKTIVAQAVMLGLLGALPGLLAGVAMAYVMSLATLPAIGRAIPFTLHPLLLVGGLAASMLLVLAAAWAPAERAARLELAIALRYE